MQDTWFSSRQRETGHRYSITCKMPHNNCHGMVKSLKLELARKFGGFSSNVSNGGWVEDGELMEEESITFNVSFPDFDSIEVARELFTWTGQAMGNDWIHIELDTFEALHTKAKD